MFVWKPTLVNLSPWPVWLVTALDNPLGIFGAEIERGCLAQLPLLPYHTTVPVISTVTLVQESSLQPVKSSVIQPINALRHFLEYKADIWPLQML